MEILLIQNVAKVGKKDDLLVVGDGFALNYLLPKRLALVATPVVRRRYAEHIKRRAEERETERLARTGLVKALDGKTVHFKRKATKTGKLYAAISEKVIADALREEHQLDVDVKGIQIGQPIKSTGTFPVTVAIGDQSMTVSVVVTADDSAE
jgi:large subunit ribosomal protein L9